jgi:hypothetical protein
MRTEEPNPASAKEQAEGSRANVKIDRPTAKCVDDFTPKVELDGKTDSGPEPDVFGREIPPQD